MKKLSQSQIIGNKGEAFASYVLSQFCLVRPVANSTDVGVDLYCESLQEGMPHNHFWVQVKTSQRIKKRKIRFRLNDLEYWLRQPIPVFVFILSLEECNGLNEFKIYVINFTNKILEKSLPSKDPKQEYVVDEEISSQADLARFIESIVPIASSLWLIREGIVRHIKKSVRETYVKDYNLDHLAHFSGKILKTIGRSSALLLGDIIHRKNEEEEFVHERTQLGNILETFKDYGNNDFHFALGMLKEKDKMYREAIICYRRALANVTADQIIDEERKVQGINLIIARIKCCETLMMQ